MSTVKLNDDGIPSLTYEDVYREYEKALTMQGQAATRVASARRERWFLLAAIVANLGAAVWNFAV